MQWEVHAKEGAGRLPRCGFVELLLKFVFFNSLSAFCLLLPPPSPVSYKSSKSQECAFEKAGLLWLLRLVHLEHTVVLVRNALKFLVHFCLDVSC